MMISSSNEGARFTVSKTDQEQDKDPSQATERVDQTITEETIADGGKKDVEVETFNADEPLLEKQDGENKHSTGNLALYEEDFKKKPKLATLLATLSNYDVTIQPSKGKAGKDRKTNASKQQVIKMGTLFGVYLPCLQNIFGVILFIRLSWIVGTAGVLQSFFIVLLCCCCTMLTAISMSAIATNGMVPGGGSYFMISRSLGPEFGGAVGILFYLGTTFASSMYILGAVEILLSYIAQDMSLFGDVAGGGTVSSAMLNNMRVYGTILLFILAILVFIGVKYVNKFASVFLLCVLLSILAIYVGFFSIHARGTTNICYVGDQLMSKSLYGSCSKDDQKLAKYFKRTEQSYSYWNNSNVFTVNGIPGITSGVVTDNSKSKYLKKNEDINGKKGSFGPIVADITSSFTVLLAIFFPSVTGIMAGSNRSGNLKDAQKSIPAGTIAAIATTSFVYLTSVLLFGATIVGDLMRDKQGESIGGSLVVANIAWPSKYVVLIGSFLSTVGAGLQSLTGAPRLLQAIAQDGIIPFLNVFAASSKGGEPHRALLLTICISEIGVIIASLDAVAPIITMFFLMCYGFVNFACVLQSLLKAPNWRPRFRFYHWTTSALGVLFCVSLMFISSWYYALIAMVLALVVYKYIEYRGAEKEWGDGLRGLSLNAARYSLLKLEEGSLHTKNWRPQVLVLCTTMNGPEIDEKSAKLISFIGQLKAGRGLTIIGSVVQGDYLSHTVEVDEANENLRDIMKSEKVKGFCKVIASKDLSEGYSFLIQNGGLGGLTTNTVIIAWPHDWKENLNVAAFINTVCVTTERHEAMLVVKDAESFPNRKDRQDGNIDIWWVVHDGGMMILMMFLLKRHSTWRKCKLRIFTVAQMEDNSIQMKKDLSKFLYHLRIEAVIEVIEMFDQDICAYTYERTLMMEQRKVILEKMRLTRRESKIEVGSLLSSSFTSRSSILIDHFVLQEPFSLDRINQNLTDKIDFIHENQVQTIVEAAHKPRADTILQIQEDIVEEEDNDHCEGEKETDTPVEEYLKTANGGGVKENTPISKSTDVQKPKGINLRRMNTAVRLNTVIKEKSMDSKLIMINLPTPPRAMHGREHYMEFIDVLTEGLQRVIMVRGGGHEVVTIYS